MKSVSIDNNAGVIEKLRKGDKKAFSKLVEDYSHKIYCSCKKMYLDDEEAQEVSQEVFFRLWEVKHQFEADKSLSGFIFTITKNIILKRLRRKAYTTMLEKYWKATYPEATRNTEEYLDLRELEKITFNFVLNLPEMQRKIMSLRINEGLSNDEIAERLRLSKRTVENQIYRSLKKLRHKLAEES